MFVNNYAQYLFSGDGQGITHGQSIVQLANENLSWERMEQMNIGIDAAFLNNRLQVSAEYYIAKSHDVLTSLELLMSTGNGGGNPFVNAASIENRGFELTATWRDNPSKDFSYSVSANISHSDNS
jgi:outer membrane receptor protein involved in Fe transport